MLRVLGITSFRLGAIVAAALITSALGPDAAEAKRGMSFDKSHHGGSQRDKSSDDDAPARQGDDDSGQRPADDEAPATAHDDDGEAAVGGSAKADTDRARGEGGGVSVPVEVRASAPPSEDEKRTAAAAKSAPTGEPDKDYYGKRASSILKNEDGALNQPRHPLAAAHPGMDVVVCEGGCNEVPAEIVYMQPTTFSPKPAEQVAAEKAAKEARLRGEKVAAASAPTAPAATDIRCLGGCYDTPRHYAAAVARGAAPVAFGEWMTSVTPTSAMPGQSTPGQPTTGKTGGSGDWMRKIDGTRGAAQAK